MMTFRNLVILTVGFVLLFSCSKENEVCDNPASYTYFLPNAFTPNEDGVADKFYPTGDFAGIDYFEMRIFTEDGKQIFTTTNIYEFWDGKYKEKSVPEGLYMYRVDIQDINGCEKTRVGWIQLIR